jgi:hypothetical protein
MTGRASLGAPLGAFAYQFVRGERPRRPLLTADREDPNGDSAVRLPA